MVAIKTLHNDSEPKCVPALQRGGLHQPEKNIQTLLLHSEHDSFSEFILLGLRRYFYSPSSLSIGESVGRGMIDYTAPWVLPSLGHGSQVRSYLWVCYQVMFSPLALLPPTNPSTPSHDSFFAHLLTPRELISCLPGCFFCYRFFLFTYSADSNVLFSQHIGKSNV